MLDYIEKNMFCLWHMGLSISSSTKPLGSWSDYSIGRHLSSVCMYYVCVCQHFQKSSPLKPLGRLKLNFMWSLLGMGERKFLQMVLVTWPKWPPCPYMVKTLKKSSSPEPKGLWPRNLVCSIVCSSTTKFVHMMILGWPWPILRQGQIWYLMLLYGEKVKQCIFQKLL